MGRYGLVHWGPEWNRKMEEEQIVSILPLSLFVSGNIPLFLLSDNGDPGSQAFGQGGNYTTGFPGPLAC